MSQANDLLASFPKDNYSMRDIHDFCVRNGFPSLAQGMIELPPPKKLLEIAQQVTLREDVHQYRTRVGEAAFRHAICNWINDSYNASLCPENILAVSGVTGGIVSTFQYLAKNGKRRIGLLEPIYTYHIYQAKLISGTEPKYISCNKDYTLDWDAIEKALKEGIDVLLTTNPNNPSGRVWQAEEVTRLVHLTATYGTILLFDEVYSELVFDHHRFSSPAHIPPQSSSSSSSSSSSEEDPLPRHVVCVRGFSKSLSLQSWRIGYVLAHRDMIRELVAVHDPIYICVDFLQLAVASYLSDERDDAKRHVEELIKLMKENWVDLEAAFEKAFGWKAVMTPQGSMYGCFWHTEKDDLSAVVKALEKGVGICPGSMFFGGGPKMTGMVRIHCGLTREKVAAVVARLCPQ